jgi:hypothetical protein
MIKFNVKDSRQVIVPIRFSRAIKGFSERSSPEVDDRGYAMGSRPSGWGKTDVRGGMVGLMVDSQVQLRVVREDIDPAVPLFVTSSNPGVLAILEPADGGPLPASGIFKLKGTTIRGDPGKIEVRLGSPTGPVLGELEPHLLGVCRVPIQVHRVRCDSAISTGNRPSFPIERILRRIRAIWWPCGIELHAPASRPVVDDDIILSHVDQVNDPDTDAWREVIQVLGLQRGRLGLPPGTSDQAVNWYIIARFSDASTVGLGISRDVANAIGADTGVFTTADGVAGNDREIERVARTLAHEIGHFLSLAHVQGRNADNPVQDTYGRRQLMYPISWLDPGAPNAGLMDLPRGNDVSYGNGVRGCLITMKDLDHHATDGECAAAIRTYLRGRWY